MAEPTMVPTPTAAALSQLTPSENMEAESEVKSSGAEEPAARKVAPATSGVSESTSEIFSSDG